MASLSIEEENYVRISLLLNGVSPRAVRCLFDRDKDLAPAALPTTIQRERNKLLGLKAKRIVNAAQWNMLYPANGIPDSNNFDVTLMICLLRNLTKITPPTYGFDCLPPPGETTEGADLARIKYYRNFLANLGDCKVDTPKFIASWTDVANAIGRLGGQFMVQECMELKVKILDQSNKEIMLEIKHIIELQKPIQDISKEVDTQKASHRELKLSSEKEIESLRNADFSLKTDHKEKSKEVENMAKSYVSLKRDYEILAKSHDQKIKEIDNLKAYREDVIPWNVRELINRKLETWKKKDQKFVETRAAKRILECVKTDSFVTVTGSSGMGKTFTVRHVALQMAGNGYDILPVTSPKDIEKYHEPNKKTLFVIDDFCGRYRLNQNDLDKWKSLSDTITDILEDKVTKIIVSCRSQVYQDELLKTFPLFTSCECNLMSKELRLLETEKQSLAELYLKTEALKVREYLDLYDCFPLLCKLYSENQNFDVTDFFKNPYSVYEIEVSKLWTERAYGKYCALALCVMFNNHFKEEWLTNANISTDIQSVIENTLVNCKLDRGTSGFVIRDELDAMNDTFVKKVTEIKDKSSYYYTCEEQLFDYLVRYFGKVMMGALIKNADSLLIAKRFLFEQDESSEFSVIVPDTYQQMYLQRMVDDWAKGHLLDVFKNANMKKENFRYIFSKNFKSLDPILQKTLAEIGTVRGTSPLTIAYDNGYEEIVEMLLEVLDLSPSLKENFILAHIDRDEFHSLLLKGSYKSYENRINLAGPCNVGKTALTSILTGDDIPMEWNSTNGLQIYFGQNGIDLKKKKMIPISEGERGRIVQRHLLTAIREKKEKRKRKQNAAHSPEATAAQSVKSSEEKGAISMNPLPANTEQTQVSSRTSDERMLHVEEGISRSSTDPVLPKRKPTLHETIHKNMLEDIRNDEYSLDVAPSDLIDFGGQRAFDMIHQLFLSQHGTVLLMFNGRYDLNDLLPEYNAQVTTAEILVHWVNSVLTYCAEQPDGMPVIQFVATHADSFPERTQRTARQLELERQLDVIFSNNEKKVHLHYRPLFFINATDKNDEEIENLKDKLVEVAFKQMHWGREMPLTWVPLEKQISDLRHQGKNILHFEDLLELNAENEDFKMDETQLTFFLRSQHNLGKLLFFDEEELRNYVIIEPIFLVNVLKSIITDDFFIPKDMPEIVTILHNLQKDGFISKDDLFKVWGQPEYKYLLKYKDYLVNMLEMLGVIVKPKTSYTQKEVSFIVPSMVRETRDLDYMSDNSICMGYVVATDISRILFFRLTAAAIGIWALKKQGDRFMLFQNFVTFQFDENNEFSVCLENERIDVYFTHKTSIESIQPDYVTSVQECLTLALRSIVKFFQTLFSGRNLENQIFQTQYGVVCAEGACFFENGNQQQTATWVCQHNHVHDAKFLWYWDASKLKTKRIQNVSIADFPPEILTINPPSELIQKIALSVGTMGRLLGKALGLSDRVLQRVMIDKTSNIFQKTEKIVGQWLKFDGTIENLIHALLAIGGRGIETITKFFQLKYTCKWQYCDAVDNVRRRPRSKSLWDLNLPDKEFKENEWFFKLKLSCDNKYDVHVINSYGIERLYPHLEKHVKRKENTIQLESLKEFERIHMAVSGKLISWETELINAIGEKQMMMCRWILTHEINSIDLENGINVALKERDVESSKALAWGITRQFYLQYRNNLGAIIDIYPGVRCLCSKEDADKQKLCSNDKVISVITREDITDLPNKYSGFAVEIHNIKTIERSKNEGATIAHTLSQKCKESFCLDVGMKADVAKDLFFKHSNLTLICPSILKSCSFNTAQQEIKDELCIQLHCKRKGIIPFGENHLPSLIQGIPTDVIEGIVEQMTKLRIGEKIRSNSFEGTLGGFVRYMKLDCFLTCAHVMFDIESLIKPDFKDLTGSDAFTQIAGGQLIQCGNVIRKVFNNGDPNRTSIDAAVVLMQTHSTIDPNNCTFAGQTLLDIGLQSPYLNENCLEYADYKDKLTEISCHGAVTGPFKCNIKFPHPSDVDINLLSASTTAVNVKGQTMYPLLQTFPAHLQFSNSQLVRPIMMFNQIEMQIPLKPGDSGTAIYVTNHPKDKNGCIGMFIASNTATGRSYVTPLTEILKSL